MKYYSCLCILTKMAIRKTLILIVTLAMLGASDYSHPDAKLGVQVEMRDGVNLLTDIYLPTGD